jgi:16S rRNA (adenine1518-N6/adenine1519-N6)-dimethyltransferase
MGQKLGQNFLIDKSMVEEIINSGNLSNADVVLEIGPGKGVLTEALLEKAGRVVAVEKDSGLVRLLREKFATQIKEGGLELVEKDIRDLETETFGLKPGAYKLIANIPYYITGEIIRTFLSGDYRPERIVLLVQDEVANRVVSKNDKESILSISVKAYGIPEKVLKVPKEAFSPAPKVDSAILVIKNINKDFFKGLSEKDFFTILKTGFAHKRKKLMTNLSEIFPKDKIITAFKETSLTENTRAEEVSLEKWKALLKLLS